MKQIAFVSGKGGTGKSTLVSSLSLLLRDKMLADCDVDAPNLHILLNGKILKQEAYYGAQQAIIDSAACLKCGLCRAACRFDAISDDFEIMPLKCEGCGACLLVCPEHAITLAEAKTGETYVSRTARGTFSHALLDIGAEGSGKLVTEVRKNIFNYEKDEKWVLIDGSPGIGCVIIATITGTDAVVAVAEPTKSGQSDLKRVLEVTRHFGIPAFVCINKYDLNPEVAASIEGYCQNHGFPVIGKIPFDPSIMQALQEFKTPIEAGNEQVTHTIAGIWDKLTRELARSN